MILNWKDDGKWRGDKGRVGDGLDHLPERDLGGQGVAVVDDGVAAVAVPAVQFHAAAAGQQNLKKYEISICSIGSFTVNEMQ